MVKRGKWDEDTPVPSFKRLPEKVPELKRVCRLAYESLFKEEVQLEFTDSDTGEDFQHLGLLSETKEKDLMGVETSYYSFLHLSIQEFLAACHVSWNTCLILTQRVLLKAVTTCNNFSALNGYMRLLGRYT